MKQAIITGGGGDIGRAIARLASLQGYRVGLLDVSTDLVNAGVTGIDNAVPLVADITDPDAVAAALQVFDATPDLLVNNAGLVRFGPLEELPVADFQAVVDVNLVGTFVMSQAVAPLMMAQGGGAIVNITSMAGIHPAPGGGAYAATKAGIQAMTQLMSIEWGPHGVRANAVAPGFIDAGMSAPFFKDQAVRDKRSGGVPLRRLGTAEDVAETVMFLASDDASYISGQEIAVDGGVINAVLAQLPRE